MQRPQLELDCLQCDLRASLMLKTKKGEHSVLRVPKGPYLTISFERPPALGIESICPASGIIGILPLSQRVEITAFLSSRTAVSNEIIYSLKLI